MYFVNYLLGYIQAVDDTAQKSNGKTLQLGLAWPHRSSYQMKGKDEHIRTTYTGMSWVMAYMLYQSYGGNS